MAQFKAAHPGTLYCKRSGALGSECRSQSPLTIIFRSDIVAARSSSGSWITADQDMDYLENKILDPRSPHHLAFAEPGSVR